ncbi:hypothetical protein VDGL01_11786 [Verticillium dahliae]
MEVKVVVRSGDSISVGGGCRRSRRRQKPRQSVCCGQHGGRQRFVERRAIVRVSVVEFVKTVWCPRWRLSYQVV